jgi:hypothetical protein
MAKCCIMTHYVAVMFKWTCGDTGLQTGIPDSVQNFDIQTDRHHEENWWNTEMQF